MNSPRETLGPVTGLEVRKINLGLRSVEIDTEGVLFERPSGSAFNLRKEQAIKAAEAIIIAYNVPFCHRVEGAGVNNG